jgi:CHAT domain-containing protein/Tfp pilus assembly protein PilF
LTETLETLQKVLATAKEIGERLGVGAALNYLGSVYRNLGQYARALEFFLQSLAIARFIGDSAGVGTALSNIGTVYHNLGQYPKALEFFLQSLAIARFVSDKAGEGRALNNIGLVYGSQSQYATALQFYQQANAIATAVGNKAEEGRTLNNIGLVYCSQGQYATGLQFYQQANAIARAVGDKAGEGTMLSNIGLTYLLTGNFAEAETVLLAAVEVKESLRPGLTDADKVSIFDTHVNDYLALQKALIAQNKNLAALEISERGRARAFVELLAKQFSAAPVQTRDVAFPDVASLQPAVKPPTLWQIQQIAKQQNAALVEYSIFNQFNPTGQQILSPALYIWVVKPSGEIAFRSLDITSLNTILANLIASSRESIGVFPEPPVTGIVSRPASQQTQSPSQTEKLQFLHKLLIEPIADLLPNDPNEKVIFIPQDDLFLIPFPALQDRAGKSLIEKHTILTAPAIQVLELTRHLVETRFIASPQNLVVGNPTMPSVPPAPGEPPQQLLPLPGAEREAFAIAPLLNTKPITGNQATKAFIVKLLPKARIIHLATHGLLDAIRGLDSAIALAPSGNDNGLLTAEEILNLKLNAELVVLSACNTGRGKITGDGVVGLSRALISAGTPSVIVSLWSVPDAPTASLMAEFYQNLQKNPDKARALRSAMLATKQQHPNPRDWAAFTLIGESESSFIKII